ncbi:2OG-Fe dioxygenase domain-containing protein [Pochonia chlamydosporia 170]|uniref:2OG-Fe dioxygenase domain-containing protein n=1 Tax=Pochonia chlamydosporia 170 TaxID=1380566 RepID=A0A179G3H7_METCM|nr:2OG-Fe dioxygenase domain-containing protein [Pochonia chlamydosporia 170]OAQ72010.1 2OG-Fe dioxygenase domain-containing protein [Pochonia chlamydosporia 170]
MGSLSPALRTVRVSATQLPIGQIGTSSASYGRRFFHESNKDKAVEAVAAHHAIPHHFIPPPTLPKHEKIPDSRQLQVGSHMFKPSFYQAVAEVMKLRERYLRERAIFVRSKDMLPILLGLGAHEADVASLAFVSDSLEDDPTLPFRKSRNSRFCLDFGTQTVRRLEYQPFMLSEDEDFKRHDSGKLRHFNEVQNDLQLNSVFQALLVFKAMVINGISIKLRPNLDYSKNQWVCTLFNLRTITTPDILGEPALEGVHSDGVDHTMTTFLGSTNMTSNSGATFIHDMDETTGISLRETSPHNILGRIRHSSLLDTLVVVDHERKHSLTAVYPEDKSRVATRDMLIFFTRRPYSSTHVAASMDSLRSHLQLPMEVPLFDPSRR